MSLAILKRIASIACIAIFVIAFAACGNGETVDVTTPVEEQNDAQNEAQNVLTVQEASDMLEGVFPDSGAITYRPAQDRTVNDVRFYAFEVNTADDSAVYAMAWVNSVTGAIDVEEPEQEDMPANAADVSTDDWVTLTHEDEDLGFEVFSINIPASFSVVDTTRNGFTISGNGLTMHANEFRRHDDHWEWLVYGIHGDQFGEAARREEFIFDDGRPGFLVERAEAVSFLDYDVFLQVELHGDRSGFAENEALITQIAATLTLAQHDQAEPTPSAILTVAEALALAARELPFEGQSDVVHLDSEWDYEGEIFQFHILWYGDAPSSHRISVHSVFGTVHIEEIVYEWGADVVPNGDYLDFSTSSLVGRWAIDAATIGYHFPANEIVLELFASHWAQVSLDDMVFEFMWVTDPDGEFWSLVLQDYHGDGSDAWLSIIRGGDGGNVLELRDGRVGHSYVFNRLS